MSDEKTLVPYIVHESEMARQERSLKRMWVLCIVIFLAFVISNGAWIYYESQWEVVDTSTITTNQDVTQDSGDGGLNQFIGGDYHGEAESKDDYNDNKDAIPATEDGR